MHKGNRYTGVIRSGALRCVFFSYTEVSWFSNRLRYIQHTQKDRNTEWEGALWIMIYVASVRVKNTHTHTSVFISWAGLSPDEALSYSLSLMECFIKSLSNMCSVLALLCGSVYCPDSDVTVRLMCRIFHCYGLLLSSIC